MQPHRSTLSSLPRPIRHPCGPHKNGSVRGVEFVPLYPTVPEAARRDAKLYALLALFDALRTGQARERNLAQGMLEERIQ